MEEKKKITLRFFVSETEEIFIKNYLKKYNDSLSAKNSNIRKQKQKSLSEFVREIVLNHIIQKNSLDENNIQMDNINLQLDKIEKITTRTLSICFKNLEKIYDKEEAKNILKEIINKEKNS